MPKKKRKKPSKANWFQRNEYIISWIEFIVLIITLIPLSYIVTEFIVHGRYGPSTLIMGNAACSVKVINQTAYDNLLREVCQQMVESGINNLPLPQSAFVPSIYEIENTTNVAYVGFHVIIKDDSCHIQAICYSE